ncbi:MAG: shikimate kinase [Clostridiales bacterium]|nr:shikimate kinase [Clostridiales bacterium]
MGARIYGLLGRRLEHSFSVPIHQALGNEGYRLIELEPRALPAFLSRGDLGGLNVTIPYKREVMRYCDGLSPEAERIGSVNTLVRRADGRIWGYNTDQYGFLHMVRQAGIVPAGKKVLVLGSGGTSLTARAALQTLGAAEVVVISRRGEENYDTLHRHADAAVIVNTTPVGMYPDCPTAVLSLASFPRCQGVVDVIYNPRRTALLLEARRLGIPHTGGLPMLTAQAKAAEELFFQRDLPDSLVDDITASLRRETENIVLIGMPGSGKSTVGELLARHTGRPLIDIDQEVAAADGRSIPAIFAQDGEAGFRALERAAIRQAGRRTGVIIATGGGAVLHEEHYAPLKQNGRIYHLSRPRRLLAVEGRPLSKDGEALRRMEADRAPLYARFRDVEVNNSGSPAEAALQIWSDFNAYSGD